MRNEGELDRVAKVRVRETDEAWNEIMKCGGN